MSSELPGMSGGASRPSPLKSHRIVALLLLAAALLMPSDAQALSNDLKNLLNSIGREIKANQSGKFCEPQLFAEVGVSLEHVSRDLLDFRLTEDSSAKHERHEGKIEPHTGAAGGVQATRCSGAFNALWLIKPGTQADAGNIRISADVTGCPCRTVSELKNGHLQFVVPVIRKIAIDGTEEFSAGQPRDFIVEAECCGGPRQSRTGAQEAPSTATRAGAEPPKPQASPPPTPKPPPKPPEPTKPQPETPKWSVDNPCPPCQIWKDYLDRTLAEIARLEAENRALEEESRKLDGEAERKRKEIERLRNVIRLQEGTGGSASNYPQPGWTTESVTQADGRVRMTVRDASGKVVEESFRERDDLGRLRGKIDEMEASIRQDRQKQERLKQDMERNRRGIEAKKGQADAYRKGLEECIREKCLGQTALTPGQMGQSMSPSPVPAAEPPKLPPKTEQPPGETLPTPPHTDQAKPAEPAKPAGCLIQPSRPISIGPRDKIGTGAASTVKKAAGGFLGGLLGKATGGMLSTGGGSDDAASGPDLVGDPIKNVDKQTFEIGDDVKIRVGSQWTPDGLLISSEILDAPGKGTFQAVAMQSEDCDWVPPDKLLYYKLWAEWSLSVNWTRDHYVNDQLVKHEEGGWQKSGTEDIASGVINTARKGDQVLIETRESRIVGIKPSPPSYTPQERQVHMESRILEMTPIWRRAGFGAATGGIQSMGTLFRVTPEQMADRVSQIVIHVTNPRVDPVKAIPLDLVLVGSNVHKNVDDPHSIPMLADVPLLGKIFKKDKVDDSRKPLLLLIKPKIVRDLE